MKLLSSFDYFKEYYDLGTNEFCFFESLQKNVGTYKIIEGIMTALLVENNKLYFLYGDNKFLMTDSHKVLLKEKSKVEKEFILFNGNNELIRFLYSLPDPQLNASPFEYIDEEDFKWGDFVEKVINDSERKRNFIIVKSQNSNG